MSSTAKDRSASIVVVANALIEKFGTNLGFSEEDKQAILEMVTGLSDKLLERGYGDDAGEWVVIRRKVQPTQVGHAAAQDEMAADRVFFSRATALAYCAAQNAQGAAGQYRDMLPMELWQEVQQLKTFKKLS